VPAILTSWQPYALVLVGLSAVVFSQLAFRAGPLSAGLPVVVTVNPLLSVPIGAVLYGEHVDDSALGIAVECVFLGLLATATVVLVRLEQQASRRTHQHAG
jgi:hypothetical protein